ncbi:MAG: alpha/beta fold hydrolase [Acidimicrobiales bacterium]
MERFRRDGLEFLVSDGGPPDGPPVLLLHGFPSDRHCWDAVVEPLQAAGFRTLAPDQRGYSPGACPPGRGAYRLAELEADVWTLADAAGPGRPVHLVGHDWGAVVAWCLAARRPDRVASLTALSVPHPAAMQHAMLHGTQLLHSWYMALFQLPRLPEYLLSAGGGAGFRYQLRRSGLRHDVAARYAARANEPGGLTGPINWYRALPLEMKQRLAPVTVPTLFVWSDGDPFITRRAAEECQGHVTGPYRFEVLSGVSHWIPEQAPDRSAELLVEHLRRWG